VASLGNSSWVPISTNSLAWWSVPVIPATWESEIWWITVPVQLRQRSLYDPSHQKKLDMVLCSCHPSYGKKHKIGRYQSKLAQPGQKLRSYLKTNREQKDGDVAQAVECLHSKHKALSSNPSTTTKKKSSRASEAVEFWIPATLICQSPQKKCRAQSHGMEIYKLQYQDSRPLWNLCQSKPFLSC
jgi:hypothetical protein